MWWRWWWDWWVTLELVCAGACAVALAGAFAFEWRALLDYHRNDGTATAVPLRVPDWWWHERATGTWTWRILFLFLVRLTPAWVFMQHLVDVVIMFWRPAAAAATAVASTSCMMRTHHLLTLLLCFHLHWFEFLNAYSLPILFMHFVSATLRVHAVHALYLGTYAWTIAFGAYRLLWLRAYDVAGRERERTAMYLMGALVIVHVLNLIEMGSSSLLYSAPALRYGYVCLMVPVALLAWVAWRVAPARRCDT